MSDTGWVRVSNELFQEMCDQLGYDVELTDDHTAIVTRRGEEWETHPTIHDALGEGAA